MQAQHGDGFSSDTNISAAGILWMNNHALDSVDQLEGAVVAVLDRLRRPAPAAIQDGVGGGDFCCGRRVLAPHHADQDIERGSGVASRERVNFGERFCHLRSVHPLFATELVMVGLVPAIHVLPWQV